MESNRPVRYRVGRICLFTCLLLLLSSTPVFADSGSEGSPATPSSEEISTQIESGGSDSVQPFETHPGVAEELPHTELDRGEALELLQGVFNPILESSAGIFDELEVEKFLAPNIAVIPGDEPTTLVPQEQQSESSPPGEEEPNPPQQEKEEFRVEANPTEEAPKSERSAAEVGHATLLDSTVPLRAESSSGQQEAVDLGLEHSEGELQPANPLVEVGIPSELGEGIELPEAEIRIGLPGAPEALSPSIVDNSVAVYPNISQDTDLAVAPIPTGVETYTDLRSAASPRSQTFSLNLPAGASLEEEGEGAKVTRGDEILLNIPPPTALDAEGNEVPASLAITGHSLTVTVSPEEGASYPILVDPLFQSYEWYSKNTEAGIHYGQSEGWGYSTGEHPLGGVISYGSGVPGTEMEPAVKYASRGLYLADLTSATAGGEAFWRYAVPRYFTEPEEHVHSYITKLTVSNWYWKAESQALSPYLYMGLWGPSVKWISHASHEGLIGHSINSMGVSTSFENLSNVSNVKIAQVGLYATESVPSKAWTYLYVGGASVELGDGDAPSIGSASGPSQWINQTSSPISFSATDEGLGLYAVTATAEQGSPPPSWKATQGCTGVAEHACPYTWTSSTKPVVEPANLPTGEDNVGVVAEDPVGNKSAPLKVKVKVDHTAPELSLSGTVTEQATLGTKRPSYTVKWNATDGTTEHPQSGVAKITVKVDKQVVVEEGTGCSTKNCPLVNQWTLESSKYAAGQHTIEVIAKDGVNLETPKTVTITLNPSPPTLTLSGTATEQGTLGVTRPRYKLKEAASAVAGTEVSSTVPTFVSSFGSSGAGNGQFAHPGDVGVDTKGNLWVVDESNNRVQEFNEKGEFLKAFGSLGSGNGQFSRPTSLAIAANGNVWVVDAGNHRLEEFNEKGEFLKAVGSAGSGNGQLSTAEGIAIDPKGNIWVADTYNARIEKFNENGEFAKVVGTAGTGIGQLTEPTGLDVGPAGNVWVTDWANNKVVEFNEAGEYVRQFGSSGTGNGQFARPDALAIDSKGDVWVGDQNNERVQEFNQSGEYVAKFGSSGTGNGQFSFGYPMGIAVDGKGDLWVTDTGNNRVQKWQIPNYAPSYSSSFGSTGTGNGQFSHPADVAIDAKGNLWVPDQGNNRLEEFNEKGEFIKALGSAGTGNGQFTTPKSIAFDSKGNFWVADSGNSRLEEFNEKGEFVRAVGSLGSGNGQFTRPEGIAIDAKGNIWVADTYNYRIQELNEKGEFIKVVNPTGLGAIEPTGLDVGPGGNVWVADWAHNRVVEISESGALVRQFGSAGTGNGQFEEPDAVTVDSKGTVWVGDQNNGRIQGFNQSGEYLTQFGSKGTGTGQFSLSYPMGIAADAKGNLWIADTNNNRIQHWVQQTWQSEIKTEITVDGKKVDSGEVGCISESCPLTREWTLESSAYSVGKHTIVAKATDGLGNTTSKTLTVEVQRDTTKPTLEASGPLVNAPMGWVEQEGYELKASASDSGYGVTSTAFKIDGTQVASVSQTCAEGGCPETLSKSINMSTYSGGAHHAELIVKDGAGNTTTKAWTINVDPEGHVTAVEADETLEAADTTSESIVVASTEEAISPNERADGNSPSVVEGSKGIESEGTPDSSVISATSPASFSIETPKGTIAAEPTTTAASATEPVVAEEAAVVAGDTSSNSDTVIRPVYDGILAFSSIRDKTSPEAYSWEVKLNQGEYLRLANPQAAEIVFEGGEEAGLISAEPAHDAVGTAVPTGLSISSGHIVTLTVEHTKGSYVYPVTAGTGWEGGYVTQTVALPPDETEIREQIEREEQERQHEHELEEREAQQLREEEEGKGNPEGPGNPPISWRTYNGYMFISAGGGEGETGPPEPTGGKVAEGEASSSSLPSSWPRAVSRPFKTPECMIIIGIRLPEPANPNDSLECPKTSSMVTRGWAHGHFHYSYEKEVWWNNGREGEVTCSVEYEEPSWNLWNKDCHWAGNNAQVGTRALGAHIVLRHNWRVDQENSVLIPGVDLCQSYHTDMYPDGYRGPAIPAPHSPTFADKPNGACQWLH